MKQKKFKKILNYKSFTPVKFAKGNHLTGFTLIEIMVTITVFSLIFGIISALFVSAIKAQRKSLISQELLSQASYTMEYMSRQIRMAENYQGGFVPPGGCTSTDGNYNYEINANATSVKFASYANPTPCCMEFYLAGDDRLRRKIYKCSSNNTDEYLTPANFIVERFKIYRIDSKVGVSGEQPRITLFLKMRSNSVNLKEQKTIEIQNTISQRDLNVLFP